MAVVLWHDLRVAARLLLKAPAFTVVAVLTVTLGIAANTAVFSLLNGLLLRPLPYSEPHDLMLVTGVDRGQENTTGCLSYPRFMLLASDHRPFTAVAGFAGDSLNLTRRGEAEQVQAAHVSWNFFQVLGVTPALGRPFVSDDGNGAASSVVIVSDLLWRRRFGADRRVVGQSVTLDARTYTVVGVLPASFTFGLLGNQVEAWFPRIDELSLVTPEHLRSGTCYLNAIGRLANVADLEPAQAQMNVLNRRYLRDYGNLPDADPRRVMLVAPLEERLVAGVRPMLLLMAAAVGVVLLIACANVGGLVLARVLARRRELAVRALNVIVRSAGDPLSLTRSLRAAVAAVDPDQPVVGNQTLEEVLASGRSRPRAMALLLALLAASALVLAAVGLYGLVAYWVSQRTREIGVRVALGATRGDVARLVLGRGLGLVALGIGVGLAASAAVTRLMSSLVYNVATTDLISFSAGPIVFLLVAVVASWIPARRAARIDPADALRAN